ncbi:hypothetical protein ACO0K2_01360 [Undibacterium sp. MH2W]|uniref:hypothetical protein n=1 Tax=Undibacterium sp. MH2W TaxID=3413044 RepID=UPI003BF2264D
MDWVPIVLVTFKLVVLGIGMYFAIRWHYDKETNKRAALRGAGKVLIIFAIALLALGLFTNALVHMLGLELTF